MAIAAGIDSVSFLEGSQIGKNNVSQGNNSILIINKIEQFDQTIDNYIASGDGYVSKKEFTDVLKIIKFIMEEDIKTISNMRLKIKETEEEVKKLKSFIEQIK